MGCLAVQGVPVPVQGCRLVLVPKPIRCQRASGACLLFCIALLLTRPNPTVSSWDNTGPLESAPPPLGSGPRHLKVAGATAALRTSSTKSHPPISMSSTAFTHSNSPEIKSPEITAAAAAAAVRTTSTVPHILVG